MSHENVEQGVLLKIVTPTGEAATINCESVQLKTPDGVDGKNGGWIGIRRGHVDALLAICEGPVIALKDGKEISRILLGEGFASVKENVVTVLTQSARTNE